jgi:hypothetical protein
MATSISIDKGIKKIRVRLTPKSLHVFAYTIAEWETANEKTTKKKYEGKISTEDAVEQLLTITGAIAQNHSVSIFFTAEKIESIETCILHVSVVGDGNILQSDDIKGKVVNEGVAGKIRYDICNQ